MNICIISSTFLPECNGVSTHLRDRIINLSRMGHNVLLLCPDYGVEMRVYPDYREFQGEIFENVHVRPVPTKRLPQRPESPNYKYWQYWRLEEYIGSFKPDIIDVEEPERIYGMNLFGMLPYRSYGRCIGIDYARENVIPISAFYHTNFPACADSMLPPDVPTPYRQDSKKIYMMIYNPYELTLCACNNAGRFLRAHGVGNVRQGIFLGPDSRISGIEDKSPLIANNGKVKMCYAGRLEKEKDISIVLDIFKMVHKLLPETELYIAGKGEDAVKVSDAAAKETGIKYLGYLKQEELAGVYNCMDIYFSPFGADTFGLSILEAMSKGLPVVAANEGGPKELVTDGVNGFTCGSSEEFVRALFTLVSDEALRKRMGAFGKRLAKKYSAYNCTVNLIKEYEALIGRKS